MGRICMPAGGGGADLDVITASAGDVLAGKETVDREGEPLVGTVKDQGNWGFSELAAGSAVTIPEGKHGGGGKVTAKNLASQTPGDSAAGHILAGRTAWVNGSKLTGTIPSQGAATITPGTSNKTAIAAGRYASGDITVAGSSTLVASNIKKGVTIFGVTGTWEGYVTSPYVFLRDGTSSPVDNTDGATGIKKFADFNTWALKRTSDSAFINAYTILVNNSSTGVTGTASIRFNRAINLSEYKYIKCSVKKNLLRTGSVTHVLGVSASSSATAYTHSTSISMDEGVLILDISSLSGEYFLYVETKGNVNAVATGGSTISIIREVTLSNN